jgi:hypothetical protein
MRRPVLGIATIAFAVAFNLPYAWLAGSFSYPAILREPAGDVLTAFSAGGPALVLVWYAFFWAALLFVPLAAALAISRERMTTSPGLAIGAAVAGALSGAFQAVGLARWVFVIPGIAAAHAQGDPAAASTFDMLNAYGGVAIGEHLGQLLLALFAGLLGALQYKDGRRLLGLGGCLCAAAIALGTGEGLMLALGQSGDLFSLFTIAGFLALSVWLIATGVRMLSARPASGGGAR